MSRTGEERKEVKLGVFWLARPSSNDTSSGSGSGSATGGLAAHNPLVVSAQAGKTVLQLKEELEARIPGGPLVAGQTLIWRGRRLQDTEHLLEFVKEQQFEPTPETGYYVLHLSVNPSSWKTVDPASNTAARAAAERLAALSMGLTGSSGGANSAFPFNATSGSLPALPNTSNNALQPTPTLPLPEADSIPGLGPSALPSPSPLGPAMPASTSNASANAVASTSSVAGPPMIASFEQWRPFYTYLSSMSTSQKTDLIMKLQQADTHYTALVNEAAAMQRASIELVSSTPQPPRVVPEPDLEQAVENLLAALELSSIVKTAADQARQTLESVQLNQKELFGGAQIGSSVVTIGGYPFLLQVPSSLSVPHEKRLEAYVAMQKYQTIRGLLTAMLNAARTSAAYGSSSSRARLAAAGMNGGISGGTAAGLPVVPAAGAAPRINGFGAIGVGQQAAARLAGPGMPTARLAIVINLEEILSLLVPLLFLSAKLGFLIYIFARHASPRKRYIMMAMAVFWVFWEGRAIRRRRRQQEARRHQAQQVRGVAQRRDQRAPQPAQPAGGGQPQAGAADSAVPGAVAANGDAQDAQRRAAMVNNVYDQRGHNPYGQPAGGQAVVPGSPEEQALIAAGLQERLERYQRERDRARDRRGRGEAIAGGAADGALQANGRPAGSSRSHRPERPAPNRLSPKYWLSAIAKVGLSAEAREMGITRAAVAANTTSFSSIPQDASVQPVADGQQQPALRFRLDHRPPRLTGQRILRNIFVCIVLFIGTLVPEVERMRRKYLERRQRRITDLENARTAAALSVQRLQQQQTLTPEQVRTHEEREARNIGTPRRGSRPTSPAAIDQASATPGTRLRQSYLPESDDTSIANNTSIAQALQGPNSSATASANASEAAQAAQTQLPASAAMIPTSSGESSSAHSQADAQEGRSAAVAAAAAAAHRRQQALAGAVDQDAPQSQPSGELFDPPFSEAEYAAALSQPGASGTGTTGTSASAQLGSSTAAPQNSLDADERMHLGVMEDPSVPTTPLRSPGDPELEDDDALLDGDADGDGENEGEGVDDEVGMILF